MPYNRKNGLKNVKICTYMSMAIKGVLYSILNEILRMIKENVYHTKYNFAYQLIVFNYKHV